MAWQDIVGSALDLGTQAALTERLADLQRQAGEGAYERATGFGEQLAGQAAGTFKPFTVSTGLGPGISVGQEGGVSVTMPESQQADLKALARSGAQQLTGAIGPGTLQAEQERIQGMLLGQGLGGAQQDIFSQLQALRQPEQERQRLALEERLFSQGRTGVRTDMFGGTPEQFAMEKAIQEQQAADALMARQQAGAEQQQRAGLIAQALGLGGQQQALQAELGLGGVQAAFVPQQQALSLLGAAAPFSELSTRAGLQGVTTRGALELGGLESLTGAYGQAAALEQAQLNALVNSLFGTGQQTGSLFGGLFGTETEKTESQTQLEALGKLLGIGQ